MDAEASLIEETAMKRTLGMPGLAAALLLLAACASTHVTETPPEQKATGPEPGKALLYFMRPSMLGGAIQSTVYDGDRYIATVSAGTHVAYQAEPGRHMFMVIGENADFMQADLLADKTYTAVVAPRMGMWKARFSLNPNNGEYSEAQVSEWLASTKEVTVNDEGLRWAEENAASIQKKKAEDLPRWQAKPEPEKQILRAESGR
jgi:hypothetical protein